MVGGRCGVRYSLSAREYSTLAVQFLNHGGNVMTAQIGQLVRDLLAGDLRSYPERTAALDEPGWNAFGEIVGAAFYSAVGRRFDARLSRLSGSGSRTPPGRQKRQLHG